MTKPFDIRDFEEIEQNPFVIVDAKDRPLAMKEDGSYTFGEGMVIYFRTMESAESFYEKVLARGPVYVSDQATPTRVLKRRTPRHIRAREDVSPFESLARTILRDPHASATALNDAIDFLCRP